MTLFQNKAFFKQIDFNLYYSSKFYNFTCVLEDSNNIFFYTDGKVINTCRWLENAFIFTDFSSLII